MRRLFSILMAVVVSILTPQLARAQNVNGFYSGTAQTLTYIQQQYVFAPLPQATITVCLYPASLPTPNLPCTNLATLYADPTTSTPAPSQFAADSQGNFSFWAPVGYYAYTITNLATNVTTGPYSVVSSPGGGGGGGGGAVLPFPGLVYATSNSAGTVATSSQIVSALNTSPSTRLLPSLLPIATTSALGVVKPDGTSITINPTTGVISSVPPVASIPATTSVLKGTGVVNVATAATPGTDYVVPSGSITGSAGSLSAPSTLPNNTSATTQSPGDNSTKLATDAFVLANAGGNPGGANTQVQFNNSSAFAGDSTFTFNNSTKYLTFQNATAGPLGTANSGTNFNSGIFQQCGSYYSGSAQPACFSIQTDLSSGTTPYVSTYLGISSPGGGQINLGYSAFVNGFSVDAQNDSALVQFSGPANMPGGPYQLILPAAAPSGSNDFLSCPYTSTGIYTCVWSAGGGSGAISVTPQQFGGYGDALSPADGCITTASSTTVTCADAPFVSSAVDGGKQIWVEGGGAAGVAFHATINSVTSSTQVVVSTPASTSVTQSPGNAVYGHDDAAAVQACWQYSATNAVPCMMTPLPAPSGQTGNTGFLIGSAGLQLVPNNADEESNSPNVIGSAGVNLFCEYNGDCISLYPGPLQFAFLSNLSLRGDATQPSSRGIHLNAAAGTYNTGGLWNSTFTNLLVTNFAQECLWMDGGGGVGYEYNLPNQIDTFSQFQCDGPNQMHTAALIKLTGQAAQIIFQNGQANGDGPNAGNNSWTYYPNPMIDIEPSSGSGGVTPVDVKFYGYTYEVGTQGLKIGNGGYDDHFDNGYVENVGTPLIAGGANSSHITFNGNHIANSGNITGIAQFTGNVTGGMRDNFEYGGAVTVSNLAVCSGTGNTIDFAGNVINGAAQASTNCVTSTASSPSSSTLTVTGGQTVNVGTSEVITTIAATGISPGKTLTLYASGAGIALGTGGNISLGPYSSPLGVPPGGTITLTLFDQGTTWTVTGANPEPLVACTAPTMTYRWTPNSACSTSQPCATDQVAGNNASQTTSGDLPTYSATGGPNGTPALVFNGTSDYLVMTTPIPANPTALTMYAIFNPAGVPSGGHDYDFFAGSNNSIEYGIDVSGDNAFFNSQDIVGVSGNKTFPAGTWYTEVVTFNNGTSTIALYGANGGALTSDGGPQVQALTLSTTTPNLGGNTVNNNYFNGSIAEWGFLSGTASPAGIAQWSACHYGT